MSVGSTSKQYSETFVWIVVHLIYWWIKTLWRVGGGDDRNQVELVQTPLTHLRLRSRGAVQSNVITSKVKKLHLGMIYKNQEAVLLHFLTCSIARL